ncbi:MAG: protein kinase [Planctomycetota bacterium]|nr:protein kinase [Planctomycetota bacterium]
MHGLILVQLQKFAQQTFGPEKWRRALSQSGLDQTSFSAGLVYEDRQALELIVLASQTLRVPVDEVVELFGRFLSTELIRLYSRVIKPEWRTLDIIENTETFIHSAVRVGNPGAVPPVLDAIRLSENELQLLYSSDRKLCKLAIGIIHGLADHFQEVIEVHKDSCMLQGDPFCTFRLIRNITRRDTEKLHVQNTIQFGLDSPLTVQGVQSTWEGGTLKSRSERSESEPTQWGSYLSPSISGSDFASIGPYRVLAQHGEGGMGCVFRAIDTRTEQTVAIKVLHPKVSREAIAKKRFLRELQALQQIRSPHVVEVRDVGEVGQLPYLVMEFLRGTNLQVYRQRFQTLPIQEILRIAIETADGLAAVHQCGLIHRDIKPENLWIESTTLNVKIIDFGLAHAVSEEMRLTRTGTFIGTPSFMAPEQASGGTIDQRADFFSLGCVLYDLSTGRRPFDRENILSTLSALANHTPEKPRVLAPDCPEGFSELIMRMLEKDPAKRPQNCQEISKRLKAILASLA